METKADIDNLRTENSTLQQENLKLVQTLNQLKVELAAAEAQNNQNASAIMQQLFQAAQNASALAPLTMPAPVPPVAPQAAAPTEKQQEKTMIELAVRANKSHRKPRTRQ